MIALEDRKQYARHRFLQLLEQYKEAKKHIDTPEKEG